MTCVTPSLLSSSNREPPYPVSEVVGLYEQVDHRLGEANVLSGLGDLESRLGRNDQAREAYTQARALYKQEDNRLGEANVLSGLGRLYAEINPELARQHFYQAARLYEDIGLEEWATASIQDAQELNRKQQSSVGEEDQDSRVPSQP